MRSRRLAATIAASATLLGACGAVRQQQQQVVTVAPCDTVSANATTYGRSRAALYAERNLRLEIADSRGDLVGSGLRRVRVIAKRTTCRPYTLFGTGTSLTSCTAVARLCGR
jgi:hypothetical protein